MLASKTFFTSDTHFGHRRVLEDRPFETVEEMDAELVRRWNVVVTDPDAVVFHLGDFALCRDRDRVAELRAQLCGSIVLVLGNHDSRKVTRRAGFEFVVEGAMDWAPYGQGGPTIHLSHVPHPLEVKDRDSRGVSAPAKTAGHACGHVHKRWKSIGSVVNVGVDQWGYGPVSWAELRDEMKV